jgi:peptidoglycan hydrolase CwlO-like protein
LELCRFSITELEKELSDVRHKMDQKKVLISRWEKEIENANQVINEERFKYNQ